MDEAYRLDTVATFHLDFESMDFVRKNMFSLTHLQDMTGSGQLAHDIHVCVKRNELGIDPPVWRHSSE